MYPLLKIEVNSRDGSPTMRPPDGAPKCFGQNMKNDIFITFPLLSHNTESKYYVFSLVHPSSSGIASIWVYVTWDYVWTRLRMPLISRPMQQLTDWCFWHSPGLVSWHDPRSTHMGTADEDWLVPMWTGLAAYRTTGSVFMRKRSLEDQRRCRTRRGTWNPRRSDGSTRDTYLLPGDNFSCDTWNSEWIEDACGRSSL